MFKVLGELKFWQDEHSKTGVSESVLRQWKGEIISATKGNCHHTTVALTVT